jgi:hypothetical protein
VVGKAHRWGHYQNKVPAHLSWGQCWILVMPLSEGLTICSDLKAPAQGSSQGQRWTLVTPLFKGLIMHNDHSEICRDLSSCFKNTVGPYKMCKAHPRNVRWPPVRRMLTDLRWVHREISDRPLQLWTPFWHVVILVVSSIMTLRIGGWVNSIPICWNLGDHEAKFESKSYGPILSFSKRIYASLQ